MVISANTSAMNNLTHCFLALDVEPIGPSHTEPGEDLSVHLLTADEMKALLKADAVKQALMAAPLWKYFAIRS